MQWFYPLFGVRTSPVVAADGTLYIGTDNALIALNSDGTLKWTYEATDVRQPIVDADGTIYFPSYDVTAYTGRLNVLTPDKVLKWSYQSPKDEPFNASPAIGIDGTVYISGSYDYLYAINPDGAEKWHAYTGGSSMTPAVGADGTLYVGGYNSVYAFNSDGTKKWVYGDAGSVDSTTIAPDGTVYIGNTDGEVFAFVDNSGGVSDSPWPMFGRDAQNTNNVGFMGAGESIRSWNHSDPFAAYTMDAIDSTTLIDQKGTYPGTIVGATTAIGVGGNALEFDDFTEVVHHGDILSTDWSGADNQFSISLWAKPTAFGGNDLLISKYETEQGEWFLRFDSEGHIEFGVHGNLVGDQHREYQETSEQQQQVDSTRAVVRQ